MATDAARLFFRDIGEGRPVVVLHGGPDFDQQYLIPELDRLAGSCRLIYYDQRGRGRSAEGVHPEDVTIGSEVEDLDRVRRHFDLDRVAVLGHSWGGVLAMEYATRHPERLSHLILMNTAPASHDDLSVVREHIIRKRAPGDDERMRAIASSAAYERGDLDAEAEFYRIHFAPTVHRSEQLETIVGRLRANFTEEGVVTARTIEHRLYDETWRLDDYDLIPRLRQLDVSTLVIHGDDDLVPVEVAEHIAGAVPGAILAVLPGCGHFSYLQSPKEVDRLVADILARS
ncbi:MAG: alpha/beta fold hydrolase [Acidimicrobiia bacterium]